MSVEHGSPGAGQIAAEAPPANAHFLSGGGETGALMRSLDWAATALGPEEGWPQSLRSAVRIVLTSRFAMWMAWGPELTFLYNDSYARMTLGEKHPWALGKPAREVWPEIWTDIAPRIEQVMHSGIATWDEALLLFLERSGYPEETYHTFSYSPLSDERGAIAGMLCVVTEETERVIGERRLGSLRDLAAELSSTTRSEDVLAAVERSMSRNQRDLPFTLTYLFEEGGESARLTCATGIDAGHAAAPALLENGAGWPMDEVWQGKELLVVDHLAGQFHQPLPHGGWTTPARAAAIVPIARAGQDRPAGFLVAGLNPYRRFDEAYAGFLRLVAGQIGSSLANARAYEEEKRRAEALAEIDRAKTTFFSNVSHEFRTPLTLMLGPIEDLIRDGVSSDGGRETLQLVHRNGQRLLKLVNTLLEFSRIEAGRVKASYEAVDLAAYTSELASTFRAAMERVGLRLELETPPLPEPVYVDREMWEKIVLNLVSNAFKYTLEGRIEVAVREESGSAVLMVRDTGTGIPEHELPKLFNRFHRVEGARGRTHEGTGIGLALVQELVRLHGGSVDAASAPGKGSTFTVRIPLGRAHLPADRIVERGALSFPPVANQYVDEALRWVPGAEENAAVEDEANVPLLRALDPAKSRAHILLADDNADMRSYVRRLLSPAFDVTAVNDGLQALEAIAARRPDLILSDVMMPNLDGFALLRRLRASPETSSIPVLMLSARAGEEARVDGLNAGADDYLVKPFAARELLARVSSTLALARVRREAQEKVRQQASELERTLALLQEQSAINETITEALRDANRRKDEFLATLSHELRTPLTAILGWARMLKIALDDPLTVQTAVDIIEQSARAQAQLIDDVLDLSRITSGKVRIQPAVIDVSDVAGAAADAVRLAAAAKVLTFTVDLDPSGPDATILGDPNRIQQIIWNLLTNAIKFTNEGGTVRMTVTTSETSVVITVSDSGIGMRPEFLPHVFEPFRQAEGSTTRVHGGLGLGLSIVRYLVELHGGSISAASEGVDRGATFTVSLPRLRQTPSFDDSWHTRRQHAAGQSHEEMVDLTGVSVLVIDDQQSIRDYIAAVLQRAHATVRTAASVREAIRAFETQRASMVLCDIAMPHEDGYAFLQWMRASDARKHTPVVAITAFGSNADQEKILTGGFDGYIRKPVEPERLTRAVRDALTVP